jgi:hypothetical protein
MPLNEGTPEMEEEHKKFEEIKRTRSMAYKWRYEEGTRGNFKIRDPSQPQKSLCHLWHKVNNKTTKEKYWELYAIHLL